MIAYKPADGKQDFYFMGSPRFGGILPANNKLFIYSDEKKTIITEKGSLTFDLYPETSNLDLEAINIIIAFFLLPIVPTKMYGLPKLIVEGNELVKKFIRPLGQTFFAKNFIKKIIKYFIEYGSAILSNSAL